MPPINNSSLARRAIPSVPVLSMATFRAEQSLTLPSLLDGADSRMVTSGRVAIGLAPSSSDSSFTFDPRWADKRSSWFSRTVMRRAARSRIVGRRRRHYQTLQQALTGAPGWRPLFETLADGACPWVFPLLAERPEALCDALQAAGVPMVRFGATLWPGIDDSVCANSMMLGRQLVALPCHQELSVRELAWLAATVRQALIGTASA